MSNKLSLIEARQTAAELLAMAVVDLFPGVIPCQGEGTELCFFYDFVLPSRSESDFLSRIEERMRQLVRKPWEVECLEMVPANGAAWLRHQGQPKLAQRVAEQEGLVQLIRIDRFVDWCQKPLAKRWDPALVFKLVVVMPMPGLGMVRVVGLLERSKNELKREFSPQVHSLWMQAEKLICPFQEEWIVLPRAYDLFKELQSAWERGCRRLGLGVVLTPSGSVQSHLAAQSLCNQGIAELRRWEGDGGEFNEGLLEPSVYSEDRAYLLAESSEKCISFLQFIVETPKILGFEYRLVLRIGARRSADRFFKNLLEKADLAYVVEKDLGGACIQMQLQDALGRWWDTAFLAFNPGNQAVLSLSLLGPFERIVALGMEKHQSVEKLRLRIMEIAS